MFENIDISWQEFFKNEVSKEYFTSLLNFLEIEAKSYTIYPDKSLWFNAFSFCSLSKISVIILGQDPYHNQGQAHGLAFSVPKNITIPPSLKNIFKSLYNDLHYAVPNHGNLEKWTKQGVLLLNTCLSVRANNAGSHCDKGWEILTDNIIKKISDTQTHCVFLLWGKHAQNKKNIINSNNHLILEAPHPSPLSAYRGFFSCRHFSKANDYLQKNHKNIIDWSLT